MFEKIFLEKNRNIKALNKENKVQVNLTQKARLLPFEGISEKLNLSELFDEERDNCNKYRLIFDVNTICSNVLFNMKTEIVKDEGSPSCKALLGEQTFESYYKTISKSTLSGSNTIGSTIDPVDHLQAIRDTEYSHADAGKLVYHCGLDMFNNHMLRSKSFTHINKVPISTAGKKFNTIFDYQRDEDGNNITEELPNTSNTGKVTTHVYRVDGIMSLGEAYDQRLIQKDGWFGFNNIGYIEIPNGGIGGAFSVNRLMNNNKACEFIDMYPDRSLYSFVPKRNKYLNRIERNWDYCITYPYWSDFKKLEDIMAINGATCPNAIKAHVIAGKTANGHDLHVFKTIIKHNLTYGDTVKLILSDNGNLIEQKIVISGIGDVDGSDTEHCFRIYTNQLETQFQNAEYVWMRKLTNGSGCKYYLRKFKKILKDDGQVPNSSIGKLGFSENIYGDRTAEVIYTDDVDVSGLRDNLGRPLSELYFTVIKTNRGHELWYNNNIFNDQRIEFSHCFGEVTSGIETIPEEIDYNIRRLHNINVDDIPTSLNPNYTVLSNTDRAYKNNYTEYIGKNVLTIPQKLESNISEEGFMTFYGDVVEFNPSTNQETILEKICHRFNTAQRECASNPAYYDIREDVLVSDDYDAGVNTTSQIMNRGFYVLSDESGRTAGVTTSQDSPIRDTTYSGKNNAVITYVNRVKENGSTTSYNNGLFPGNLQPEGYFYQAHYPVKIRQISDVLNTNIGAVLNYNGIETWEESKTEGGQIVFFHYVKITTTDDYDYVVGDLFGLYDSTSEELFWGVVEHIEVTNDETKTYTLTLEVNEDIDLSMLTPEKMDIILTDGSVPSYASYIKEEQKFVWRDILSPSQVDSSNELSNMMFTNGRNYIQTNVHIFLKRQDPFGTNGLLFPAKDATGVDSDTSPLHAFKKRGYEINHSWFVYKALEMQNDCL